VTNDDIGDRGQWLVCLMLTELCHDRNEPYFRPRFLGDKYPGFDYLVELVGKEEWFFFIQVKTTTLGYKKTATSSERLNVVVPKENVARLVASPIPTYVMGVDERLKLGFILSVNEPRKGIGGLPTTHKLDCDTLKALWHEVYDFWSGRDMVLKGSEFT